MTTQTNEQKWYHDRWLIGLMVLTGVLGLIYNNVILVGLGVDEPRHMNYVKLLFEEQAFPRLVAGAAADAAGHEAEYRGAHTYHPPLYYLILLPFYALLHNLPGAVEWHWLRGLSLLMCLVALPFIYQIALRATGKSVAVSRLVVAQIALIPMWGMTAATIINDALVFLLATVSLWLLAVRYPDDRSLKSAGVLGVAFGLCIVSKANALPANVVALGLYLFLQYGRGVWHSPQAWKRLAVVLLTAVVIAGPWQLYNLVQYGSLTHTPPPMPSPALPALSNGVLVMMLHDNFPSHVLMAIQGIFNTLWSQKDWIPESMRGIVYTALAGYCALALSGFAVSKWRKTTPSVESGSDDLARRIAHWTTIGAFLISWLVVMVVALFIHWGWAEGGRYLFPALTGLSIVTACGWQRLLGEKGVAIILGLWVAGMLALNGATIYWLVSYLNPTYGPGG